MIEEERKERMKRFKLEKFEKIYEFEDEDDISYDQRFWVNLMKKK